MTADLLCRSQAIVELHMRGLYNLRDLLFVNILEKSFDITRDNDARSLRLRPFRFACSKGTRSEGAGTVTKFEQMDGTLPRGLLVPTLEVAVGIDNKDSVRGRGVLACEICEIKVIEEVVETRYVVLLKATRGCSADSTGVDTVVGDSTQREGEGTVRGAEGDGDGVGDTEVFGDGDSSADAVININTDGCAQVPQLAGWKWLELPVESARVV
ncbi:hypothetical protein EI94DRAFT_1790598 [Lactarius quietus]|nr:hypothetical protein EI94DRAFT_1790598 [Lactarius quietus]